jgi:hypothetical protein
MPDAELPSSQLRELQKTARRLMSEGVLWLVYELPATAYDRRQTACLIFETDNIVRRVRKYPEQWRKLSDNELLALSWTV